MSHSTEIAQRNKAAVRYNINTGQSVPIPRLSQTRAKNADLVTLET